MKKLALIAVIFAMAGLASANILVPNGDFETPGGVSWEVAGPAISGFWPNGGPDGTGDGCSTLDSRNGWGVLVSNGGAPLSLSYFGIGLAPGDTITIEMDMKSFYDVPGIGGLKMESWTATSLISYTPDMNKNITTSWATYSWDYTIAAGATHLKFVPLSVSGSVVGFDNVGVVPEPATLGLCAISAAAMQFIRRRFI